MKKQRLKHFRSIAAMALLPMLLLSLSSSCSDNKLDGNWDPMKWKIDNESPETIIKTSKDHTWAVTSNQESTITFLCKNYEYFWLDHISLSKAWVPGSYWPNHETHDWIKTFSTNWCTITLNQNLITVRFADDITPTPGYIDSDTINVGITAGDIFDDFHFIRRY